LSAARKRERRACAAGLVDRRFDGIIEQRQRRRAHGGERLIDGGLRRRAVGGRLGAPAPQQRPLASGSSDAVSSVMAR